MSSVSECGTDVSFIYNCIYFNFPDLHLLPAMHSSSGLDVYLRLGVYYDEKSGLSTRMHLPFSETGRKQHVVICFLIL